jgi:hypothetical protein
LVEWRSCRSLSGSSGEKLDAAAAARQGKNLKVQIRIKMRPLRSCKPLLNQSLDKTQRNMADLAINETLRVKPHEELKE